MIQNDLLQLAHPITKLQLLPGNPRRGDIEAVKRSLETFGQRKPIVVRRSDNVVIAGNHTLQAAQALGWGEIAVVWVDDDEVTSKAFALADNRTAELGDYDEDALADLINDVGSLNPDLLESSGWDDKAVQELLDRVEQVELATDVDDVPEDVPAVSKLGDVWLLGEHRLMCGDSTDAKNIAKLMNNVKPDIVLTDPPYGMFLDTDWSDIQGSLKSAGAKSKTVGKKYNKVIGDNEDFTPELITTLFDNFMSTKEMFIFGADYFAEFLPEKNNGSWLVWDKRKPSQEDAIGAEFELIWSKTKHKRRVLRHDWFGFLSSSNPLEARNRVHPTQKPTSLLIDILSQWSNNLDTVVDLYGGSGSTLIAAHETNRVAYLMELDPHYVDVICTRFQKLTGVLPVLESSGKVHDFLNA